MTYIVIKAYINMLLVASLTALCLRTRMARRVSSLFNTRFHRLMHLFKNIPMQAYFSLAIFNTKRSHQFAEHLSLVQAVDKPTQKANILNMTFSIYKRQYNSPCILPPVGASDHNCILLRPKSTPIFPLVLNMSHSGRFRHVLRIQ